MRLPDRHHFPHIVRCPLCGSHLGRYSGHPRGDNAIRYRVCLVAVCGNRWTVPAATIEKDLGGMTSVFIPAEGVPYSKSES